LAQAVKSAGQKNNGNYSADNAKREQVKKKKENEKRWQR